MNIFHYTSKKHNFQFDIMQAKEIVEGIRSTHDTSPTSTAALGRTTIATCLIAQDLKSDNTKIVTQINGRGPAGSIIVEVTGNNVRSFMSNPHAEAPHIRKGKLNVGGVVGTNGFLKVTKDLGHGDPFTGVVQLHNGEIAEDFARYLHSSEQVNSIVSLGVLVTPECEVPAAGGFILRLLPSATEEDIVHLEQKVSTMPTFTSWMTQGVTTHEIAKFFDEEIEILSEKEIAYKCSCSKEKTMRALALLPKKEVKELMEERGHIEMSCSFCKNIYKYTDKDLI